MKVSFYPKIEKDSQGNVKTNPEGKVPMQMVVWHVEKKKLGIGLSIFPDHWDAGEERVTKKHPSAKAVNDTIEQKRSIVEEIERQIRTANGYATVEEIAAEFITRTRPPKKAKVLKAATTDPGSLTMQQVNEKWKKENREYVKNMRKYNQVVTALNEFKPGVRVSDLDDSFTKTYLAHLSRKGYLSKGEIKDYTVGTMALHLLFIRKARAMANLPSLSKAFTVKVVNSEQPDLTIEELRAFITTPLIRMDLELERDMFVFQVLVPLRDSHYRILKPHHLEQMPIAGQGEIPVVNLFQSKTSNPVILPLPPLALKIWHKYGGVFPLYTQQKRNEHLKKIALEAKLFREFVVRTHHLKGYKEKVMPLWKVVSTYTSRHTAATLLLEQTGDESLSGWILGHKNHGISGVTGVYAKKKASKALPAILEAWEEILGDVKIPQ